MAYTWTDKTVYIRETTDGKTRWVKLEGVMARRSGDRVIIKLRNFQEDTQFRYEEQQVFISER